eukprot:1167785-Pleurochrysis_carterae.AAC.1
MDLKEFLDSDDEAIVRLKAKVGLYVVSPSGYEARKYRQAYRCGAAGVGVLSSGDDGPYKGRPGSFESRFSMYHNTWVGSGKVYGVLVLHGKLVNRTNIDISQNLVEVVMEDGGEPRDARPDYAKKKTTLVLYREALFHRLLDRDNRIQRLRSSKSEWFHAPQGPPTDILKQVGGGSFYNFTRRGVSSATVLRFELGKPSITISLRQSPRLLERVEAEQDEVEYRVDSERTARTIVRR